MANFAEIELSTLEYCRKRWGAASERALRAEIHRPAGELPAVLLRTVYFAEDLLAAEMKTLVAGPVLPIVSV